MITLLHNFLPASVLISFGSINIYWYGLFLVLAMSAGIITAIKIGRYYGIKQDIIIDASIWLIIGGLIGARIYEVFLESSYYFSDPLAIFKIWEGGLAIHGGIIGGALALIIFSYRRKLNSLALTAAVVPALALGQTIGRWGNWFNQELFGLPTNLPWGIPIAFINRPADYAKYIYFHPTFLYESLGCFLIFIVLLIMTQHRRRPAEIICTYLIAYAILRFSLEFIKIDDTPLMFGWRWPQIMSLIILLTAIIWLIKIYKRKSL